MIIYNVTLKVEHAIAAAFIRWMKEVHIPEIIDTGCFTQGLIFHLIEADDEDGITYAVQYHATDYSQYKRYIEQFSAEMRKHVADKWGNQFIAFRTVMQAVN